MSIDPKAYRAALGTFATGVSIVTARDADGGAHGLTANSFTSVSLDPPLVLWSLGDRSDSYGLFSTTAAYAVNVLEAGQDDLAMRFAGKGDQQLTADEYTTRETGSPLLAQAIATFDCEVVDRIVAGDHLMLLARVVSFSAREGDGLSYFRSRFGRAPSPVSA